MKCKLNKPMNAMQYASPEKEELVLVGYNLKAVSLTSN